MIGTEATIPLLPVPPKRRLSFPGLILKTLSNPIASWSEEFYDEPLVLYRSFGVEALYVMEPELIETILLTEIDAFSKNPPHEDILGGLGGKGLLIAEGEAWRWQRRLAAPLFSPAEVAGFVPAYESAAASVLERWGEAPPGALQPIDRDMTAATLQVLQDTVLGASLPEEDRRTVERFGSAFLAHTVWKIAFSSLGLPPGLPHPGARSMAQASAELRRVAQRVLDRRRQEGGESADLLGRLVAARDPATSAAMPDSLIIDNVVTFLMAGHETTAQALTWTLYLLALFPEWQERVRAEVGGVAGEARSGSADVARLTLLDQIFQEAMRLYPPAPALARVTSRPVEIGGVTLKKGANVLVPIYVLHRHRRLWQQPLAFDPSRFTPERASARHRCTYMPFGAGPRTCIGASFAMLEGKVMLAHLLAHARFALPPGERPVPFARITLRPKGGLKLRVTML